MGSDQRPPCWGLYQTEQPGELRMHGLTTIKFAYSAEESFLKFRVKLRETRNIELHGCLTVLIGRMSLLLCGLGPRSDLVQET